MLKVWRREEAEWFCTTCHHVVTERVRRFSSGGAFYGICPCGAYLTEMTLLDPGPQSIRVKPSVKWYKRWELLPLVFGAISIVGALVARNWIAAFNVIAWCFVGFNVGRWWR